jgi:hypothetical protein
MDQLVGEEVLQKLTPEWIAANLMNITTHLMAAIEKADATLARLADVAEDIVAHLTRERSHRQTVSSRNNSSARTKEKRSLPKRPKGS